MIQAYWRGVQARRQLYLGRQWQAAALQIQTAWRTYTTMQWYQKLRRCLMHFQAHARGYLTRARLKTLQSDKVGLP